MTFFNEHDAFAVAWLRNLYQEAVVDERSIADVQPADVVGYDRCHFFGGVAGWEYALELAGWSGPVWTGSCPCQPFSAAGKRKGTADERHMWPEFFRLISAVRPPVIFGEQVASKDGLAWLDGILSDLEGAGYACWAADLGAACVGAPHIRQRLFWVAESECAQRRKASGTGKHVVNGTEAGRAQGASGPEFCRDAVGMDNATSSRRERTVQGPKREARNETRLSMPGAGCWHDSIVIPCRDNKSRRISAESGDEPLANGVPVKLGPFIAWLEGMGRDASDVKRMAKLARRSRVGRLKGYGNAIVPEVAAMFIRAFMESKSDT